MSIIYEALKKAEKPKISKKFKKRNLLKLATFPIILGIGVLFLITYSRIVKVKEPGGLKKPRASLSRVALKKERKKPLPPQENSSGFRLSGILYSEEKPLVIINGKTLTTGEKIGEAKVSEITKDQVVLELKEKKIILTLE